MSLKMTKLFSLKCMGHINALYNSYSNDKQRDILKYIITTDCATVATERTLKAILGKPYTYTDIYEVNEYLGTTLVLSDEAVVKEFFSDEAYKIFDKADLVSEMSGVILQLKAHVGITDTASILLVMYGVTFDNKEAIRTLGENFSKEKLYSKTEITMRNINASRALQLLAPLPVNQFSVSKKLVHENLQHLMQLTAVPQHLKELTVNLFRKLFTRL